VEPAHGGTPRSGDALEDPMVGDALVLAHPYRGRVDKGDARAFAQATGLKEQGHGHQVLLHKLSKPIVGDRVGKIIFHMGLHVEKIKVLETPETAQLENNRYRYYLALGHNGRAFGLVAD